REDRERRGPGGRQFFGKRSRIEPIADQPFRRRCLLQFRDDGRPSSRSLEQRLAESPGCMCGRTALKLANVQTCARDPLARGFENLVQASGHGIDYSMPQKEKACPARSGLVTTCADDPAPRGSWSNQRANQAAGAIERCAACWMNFFITVAHITFLRTADSFT